MTIYEAKLTLTTAGGDAEGNVTNNYGICHQILATPASQDTQYEIEIVNRDGISIYYKNGSDAPTGQIDELTLLPLIGTQTIRITNATKDEQFNICLVIRGE